MKSGKFKSVLTPFGTPDQKAASAVADLTMSEPPKGQQIVLENGLTVNLVDMPKPIIPEGTALTTNMGTAVSADTY